MRFLDPKTHGFIDYAVAALLLLAPTLFGFDGAPAALCYVLAPVHTALSLVTAYPLGAAKVIPFQIHGYIELAAAVFIVLAPFLFGFSQVDAARNFFLLAGASIVAVFATTNYQAAEPRVTGRLWSRDRRIV